MLVFSFHFLLTSFDLLVYYLHKHYSGDIEQLWINQMKIDYKGLEIPVEKLLYNSCLIN